MRRGGGDDIDINDIGVQRLIKRKEDEMGRKMTGIELEHYLNYIKTYRDPDFISAKQRIERQLMERGIIPNVEKEKYF